MWYGVYYGEGGRKKWQKEKGSLAAVDTGRHSRIKFYLSDISAINLLILVAEVVQASWFVDQTFDTEEK